MKSIEITQFKTQLKDVTYERIKDKYFKNSYYQVPQLMIKNLHFIIPEKYQKNLIISTVTSSYREESDVYEEANIKYGDIVTRNDLVGILPLSVLTMHNFSIYLKFDEEFKTFDGKFKDEYQNDIHENVYISYDIVISPVINKSLENAGDSFWGGNYNFLFKFLLINNLCIVNKNSNIVYANGMTAPLFRKCSDGNSCHATYKIHSHNKIEFIKPMIYICKFMENLDLYTWGPIETIEESNIQAFKIAEKLKNYNFIEEFINFIENISEEYIPVKNHITLGEMKEKHQDEYKKLIQDCEKIRNKNDV